MEYFRVTNWDHYQHYSKRNPPWIKLYTSLLDDFAFLSLTESTRLLAFNLLMLAAKTGNKMPISPPWLMTRLALSEANLDALFEYGLIEKWSASNTTLAPQASVKERAEQKERNKDGLKTAPRSIREEGLRAIGQTLPESGR